MGGRKRNRSAKSGNTPEDKKKRFTFTKTAEKSNPDNLPEMADLEGVVSSLESADKTMQCLQESINHLSNALISVRKDLCDVKAEMKEMAKLKTEVQKLKYENTYLKERVVDLEDYSRRDNIVVTGIKEADKEDCRLVCRELFRKLQIEENVEVVRTHRLGSKGHDSFRPLIIRFRFHENKEKVMKNRKLLKDTGIFINDHLSIDATRKKNSLLPVLKELRQVNEKAHMRGAKIYSDGRLYSEKNVHELPIDAHSANTKTENDVTVFRGRFSRLSNLHPCHFEMDGKQWSSIEQILQHGKAVRAGQVEVASRILWTDDPVDIMYIGKAVNNPTGWNEAAKAILKTSLAKKFAIPQFKLALQKTGKVIGEGTRDKVYGIGFTPSANEAHEPSKWTGENLMGTLLMDLKRTLDI